MFIERIQQATESFFGIQLKHFSSFGSFVELLYQPRRPHNLAVIRIVFGMLMLLDVLFERSGLHLLSRWGDPRDCHFPLFPLVRPLGLKFMGIVYGVMWLGALGITLGYKFKWSSFMYIISYWYVLLLDKCYWNNHSYLFGVVSILLFGSSANTIYSIDAFVADQTVKKTVPYWNYFILKFQFFLLYFMAGLKKIDMEWLGGYSMVNWGTHWIFEPLKFILTPDQIDYFIIHFCGFVMDLTVGFWLLNDVTRPYAMVFCAAFHLMNSRMFSIGMFPYVCIATLPIFCNDDWPVRMCSILSTKKNAEKIARSAKTSQRKLKENLTKRHYCVAVLLVTHCGLQCFLPYSHFITKGYNNWTNGLYGYSWDMMVHSWSSGLVVVKVTDNDSGKEYFIDPNAWTKNERWSKHADMCVQYAQCLKENLIILNGSQPNMPKISDNISVYIDVWCSLNGRFQQRMFDPGYDLLRANWSPFKPVEWLLPLLAESSGFRHTLHTIQDYVYSWSNYSDVFFIADFPGMHLENYLSTDLRNITISVLDGEVVLEKEDFDRKQSIGVKLSKGSSYNISAGLFHKVHTVGLRPSLYMYTYVNETKEKHEISN